MQGWGQRQGQASAAPRSVKVQVLVTRQEAQAIKEMANGARMTVSTWLRELVYAEPGFAERVGRIGENV